jgi:hypothetical protein
MAGVGPAVDHGRPHSTCPSADRFNSSLTCVQCGNRRSRIATEAVVVLRLEQVGQFVEQHILQARDRFLRELRVESDGRRLRVAASPLGLHPANEELRHGNPLAESPAACSGERPRTTSCSPSRSRCSRCRSERSRSIWLFTMARSGRSRCAEIRTLAARPHQAHHLGLVLWLERPSLSSIHGLHAPSHRRCPRDRGRLTIPRVPVMI